MCWGLLVPQAQARSDELAQSEELPERQLRILEPPNEIQRLDPAFEMIMEKIDDDLKYILSSPVRLTPKGTAMTGLTLLSTLYLLGEDEEYLSNVVDARDEDSDHVFERLRVLGNNVTGTTAGLYLVGYFFDDRELKSRSLESLEAVAITALISAGTGYMIGHKSPDDTSDSGSFEPFSRYRSMPDINSSLIFSMASVYAYNRPTLEAIVYYTLAAGTAYSRLHFEDAWPSDVFLGSVLGTVIGRTVASRSMDVREGKVRVLPVLEHDGKSAVGVKVEIRL
jgi:hypothetical protein